MAQLTLALFSLNPYQLHNKTSAEVFSVLLPQLATTQPSVSAAAGALGAAYDKCVLHPVRYQGDQLVTRLYLNALRQLQAELERSEPELTPLLMAAMLLAAAESIQHKQEGALCHLFGALSMINLRSSKPPKPTCAASLGQSARTDIVEGLNSVQHIFHIVDYHVSMFDWGRRPWFPPLPVTSQMLYPTSVDDLSVGHPILQQWGLHFIAKALEPDWEERIDFPPALIAQQDHLIAWLKRWLRFYASVFDNSSSQFSPSQTPHFRTLKAQTLTMLIAASNVKPPTQVTYDTYAPQFEDIIRCAEYVLNTTNVSAPHRPLPPYSPFPGIIHPLYFTARKYRDSVSRRRAIHLLRHAGIEGPFHGDFEARVAARLVEIEEDRRPFKPVLAQEEVLPPSAIADRHRVYMSWITATSDQEAGKRQTEEAARRIVKFSRRRGLALVSRGMKIDRKALYVDHVLKPREHEERDPGEMWEIWEEVVERTWPEATERR